MQFSLTRWPSICAKERDATERRSGRAKSKKEAAANEKEVADWRRAKNMQPTCTNTRKRSGGWGRRSSRTTNTNAKAKANMRFLTWNWNLLHENEICNIPKMSIEVAVDVAVDASASTDVEVRVWSCSCNEASDEAREAKQENGGGGSCARIRTTCNRDADACSAVGTSVFKCKAAKFQGQLQPQSVGRAAAACGTRRQRSRFWKFWSCHSLLFFHSSTLE